VEAHRIRDCFRKRVCKFSAATARCQVIAIVWSALRAEIIVLKEKTGLVVFLFSFALRSASLASAIITASLIVVGLLVLLVQFFLAIHIRGIHI